MKNSSLMGVPETYLFKWGSAVCWLNDDVLPKLILEIFLSKGTTEGFYEAWRPFIEYFNNHTPPA